jgi:hypothetical protein
MKRTLAAAALALALALAASPLAAHAEEAAVHPDVAYALAAEPGGVATSYYSAEWPKLGMTLEVAAVSAFSVGTCATGSICAYSEGAMAGVKLSWTTCGSKSTAALDTVGSIANARSTGTLTARQGTTVRATAAANAYANVPLSYRSLITNVYC